MRRFKILHRTYYNFSGTVQLEPHVLRLRPKEGHELRIESSSLDITPAATLRWHSDVEDNSVAIATFDTPTRQLVIESESSSSNSTKRPSIFWWTLTQQTTRLPMRPKTASCWRPTC